MYCVATLVASQSSIPSICSCVFSSFKKRFLVLNCAPRPARYCTSSLCSFAATLWWSCGSLFSRILFSFFIYCYSVSNVFFFASPKKKQKKSPEMDYIPISGWFPAITFVLLCLSISNSTLRFKHFNQIVQFLKIKSAICYFKSCF
jgi:hypothetical protein